MCGLRNSDLNMGQSLSPRYRLNDSYGEFQIVKECSFEGRHLVIWKRDGQTKNIEMTDEEIEDLYLARGHQPPRHFAGKRAKANVLARTIKRLEELDLIEPLEGQPPLSPAAYHQVCR